jgi:hypothetical protein
MDEVDTLTIVIESLCSSNRAEREQSTSAAILSILSPEESQSKTAQKIWSQNNEN